MISLFALLFVPHLLGKEGMTARCYRKHPFSRQEQTTVSAGENKLSIAPFPFELIRDTPTGPHHLPPPCTTSLPKHLLCLIVVRSSFSQIPFQQVNSRPALNFALSVCVILGINSFRYSKAVKKCSFRGLEA